MRKIFIVFACALLFSCSKENSNVTDTNYHLSCKIDGVLTTFNVGAAAGESLDEDLWSFVVAGRNADSANAMIFGIVINSEESNVKVSAGNYVDSETDFEVFTGFYNPSTELEYGAGQEVYNDALDNGITIQHHFSVEIKELTDKVARGVFSGDYYKDYLTDREIKRVTEGEFYLQIQK